MTNDPYTIHEPETAKLDALRYLQLIYRDPQLSTGVRMRAAIAALNYETPRLAVQALITEQDIATVLDKRIAHYKELQRANGSSKLIEANKLIEAEPVEAEPEIEVKPPMPRIADRRYRRF
jgi:hypothetical protein